MLLRDIMTTNVISATPGMDCTEVARMMRDQDVGAIPICERDQLLGIITDRDICVRIVADGKNPRPIDLPADDFAERLLPRRVGLQ